MQEIRVTLINPSDRKYFLAQWDDPVTGLTKSRSTKATHRRDAERFAALIEKELNEGTYKRPTATTWSELRQRYTDEVSSTKADRTRLKTQSMWNAIDLHFSPNRIDAVADASFISKYAAQLRSLNLADFTIRGHLAELRKVLIWAKRMELIRQVPHIEFPRALGGMKGRPINDAEFAQMIKAIPRARLYSRVKDLVIAREAVPKQFLDGWKHYLEGLFLSGLRLEESMALHWTDDRGILVDFSGEYPAFRFQASGQKSRKFQLLPMAWEFADFLETTPKKDRVGFVFNPMTFPRGKQSGEHRPLPHHVGRVVVAIGKAAGIMVNDTKFASAHDLRRAFGFRWAQRVFPAILKEMMRHSDIKTTMEFYVGSLADDSAKVIWEARRKIGNSSGNSSPRKATRKPRNTTK